MVFLYSCACRFAAGVLLGTAAILPLSAQQAPDSAPAKPPPPPPNPWSGTIQANGTAFFGSSDQRVVGARSTVARTDSSFELGASAQVVYGDAKRTGEARRVSKRTLRGTVSLDYRPHASLSPFVLGTLESNLEKKIESRYSISVGAKQTLIRTPQSETSISAALLDEFTVPVVLTDDAPSTRLTRWSFRGRVRHRFDDRLRASHVTFYMPSARTSARYLVRSTSEAHYAITRVVNLTTSLQVNYDSEAIARGALVNHDGQLLFGIGAKW